MDGVSAPSERSEPAAPARSTLRNQVALRGPLPARVALGRNLRIGLCRDLQAHITPWGEGWERTREAHTRSRALSAPSRALAVAETSNGTGPPTDGASAGRPPPAPRPVSPPCRPPPPPSGVLTFLLVSPQRRCRLWSFGRGLSPRCCPPTRSPGHATASARSAAAAGPPGLSREPREEEAPAAEPAREPRRRAARRTQYYGCVLLCTQQLGDHE